MYGAYFLIRKSGKEREGKTVGVRANEKRARESRAFSYIGLAHGVINIRGCTLVLAIATARDFVALIKLFDNVLS